MQKIMASELARMITESVEQYGDRPIVSTDYCPPINKVMPATFDDGSKCFFLVCEPRGRLA